jgi:hypothetical protein
MANWREELTEAVKTVAEREAEEAARLRQRVAEALGTAESAFELAVGALRFAHERIAEKGRPVELELTPSEASPASARLLLGEPGAAGSLVLGVQIDRETAVVKVHVAETKPREFDFAKDRHIAALDVEEYVGRRAVELVRSAQKAAPW